MARSLKRAWWALTFVFAAVQMVITLHPANIPIAATGSYFSLDFVLAPVVGYMLGSFYGTISILLGTFIAAIYDPWAAGAMASMGILGAILAGIAPATGAFVAGLIRKRRYRAVPLFFIITIGLFLITRVGLLACSFLWLHIITLLLSLLYLVPQFKDHLEDGLNLSDKANYTRIALAILLFVFISVMADHIVAGVLRAYLFLVVPAESIVALYTDVIFIYPIERFLASIAGALVIILVAAAIKKADLCLPTRPIKEKEVVSIELLKEENLAESRTIEELIPSGEDS
jgi:hypothetical protein